MVKRKPANEYHQMLPYYDEKIVPKQIKIDFQSARGILKEDDKMVVRRQFERINIMMDCNLYTKYEDIPENKEIFV